MIELVCCDMAGTTVNDGGLVLETFHRTIASLDLDETSATRAEAYVIETMGQSKFDVFRALFAERAEDANRLFEAHFVDAASDVGVSEVPGARLALETLLERGIAVALTTGFSPATRESIIDALGWADLVEVRVSPADAGRGRPAPDMVLTCALRARVNDVRNICVVGDTASDMMAGRRAGAGLTVGVLTGNDEAPRLVDSGADLILNSIALLPDELVE